MVPLIVGCGYLGRAVASAYLEQGLSVTGLVRSPESADKLRALGARAAVADLDASPLPDLPLESADLFNFCPPPAAGDEDSRVQRLIEEFSRQGDPRRIVHLSTTGVYGDCGGQWVDETRPVGPVAARAKRRMDGESRLREWRERSGGELVILRVAGIYGPGKLPLERLRQGLPLIRESEAPFSNRIHVADLVRVCVAAMERGGDGEIYNVSDGHPTTMTDYFNRLADTVGLPRPPLISLAEGEQQLSAGMMSYMRESRRLDNRKMLRELGVKLQYPTLAQGLPVCLD
jgi:nucleoside-diphosphate-sugar epimerase